MPNEFSTMREIGKMFGVSSHVVGKKLKAMRLRTEDGKPSDHAFALKLVEQRWADDGEHYCWAWHTAKTVPILESAGLVRISPDAP